MKLEPMVKLMKLIDSEDFREELEDLTDFQLEGHITTMKSLYNDTKRMAYLMLRLKDLNSTS
jgi:hypothetical protein